VKDYRRKVDENMKEKYLREERYMQTERKGYLTKDLPYKLCV